MSFIGVLQYKNVLTQVDYNNNKILELLEVFLLTPKYQEQLNALSSFITGA